MAPRSNTCCEPNAIQTVKRIFFVLLLVAALGGIGWAVKLRIDEMGREKPKRAASGPVPVEVAQVERGQIEMRRTFSGTLEAFAQFVVAPKVGGRVESMSVDLSDRVRRGQVVAELDDDEFEQAVAQATAEVAVADANIIQAQSALGVAERELERVQKLREDGVSSDSDLDTAKADVAAKRAGVAVTKAQAERARAVEQSAKIRKNYTQVRAAWPGMDEYRVVADRHAEEGDTVSPNAPLLTIVRLDPIIGVVFVTERDYARLAVDQRVTLTTDAHPGRPFTGRIERIAPVFRRSSRQARVELSIANGDHALKPGMFVRAEIVLATQDDAVVVPEDALVLRDEKHGVFVVDDSGDTVRWEPVTVGIRQGKRVQVVGKDIVGRVVTLGQQLIGDGSKIVIPQDKKPPADSPNSTDKQAKAGDAS